MKMNPAITRRSALALAAGALSVPFANPVRAADGPSVVVELFTSEGCSSCPAADAFFKELKAMPGVLALSYHVDYWDYLGWKDTLGSPENSQRQYDYAHARGDMDVYTPQIIIDGGQRYVGSNRAVVLDAIARARSATPGVPVALTESGMELVVDIGAALGVKDATLWLMPVEPEVSVKIPKGEIAGQEIVYNNVVRRLVPAGMWSGEARTLRLPKDGVLSVNTKGCVALLQQGKVGPVLGVAAWGQIGA